jgi:hypothetical protein
MRMPVLKLALAASLFLCLNGQAQIRAPFTNNDLRTNLSKVLSDYVMGFAALKADTISLNPQSVEFTTNLDFKSCEENSITQYNSKNKIYSWQAVLLSSEDFEESSKKYKWLYNQLKVMTVKVQDYTFTLSGEYNAPDESKNFCSTIFKLTPNASNMPKLKIEASMQFQFPEWKIRLLVYERERDDSEQGDINGD